MRILHIASLTLISSAAMNPIMAMPLARPDDAAQQNPTTAVKPDDNDNNSKATKKKGINIKHVGAVGALAVGGDYLYHKYFKHTTTSDEGGAATAATAAGSDSGDGGITVTATQGDSVSGSSPTSAGSSTIASPTEAATQTAISHFDSEVTSNGVATSTAAPTASTIEFQTENNEPFVTEGSNGQLGSPGDTQVQIQTQTGTQTETQTAFSSKIFGQQEQGN